MIALNITGAVFGRLTALRDVGKRSGFRLWQCRCECGAETEATTRALRAGTTQSCGCLRRDMLSAAAVARNYKHGHNTVDCETPTHKSWVAMIRRTTNSAHKSWAAYGGRGITVCAEWREFSVFLASMGERPVGTTIDRINVNGNYEPSNCRWATLSEQQRNKRTKSPCN